MTSLTVFVPRFLGRKAPRSIAVHGDAHQSGHRPSGDPRLDLAKADDRFRQLR